MISFSCKLTTKEKEETLEKQISATLKDIISLQNLIKIKFIVKMWPIMAPIFLLSKVLFKSMIDYVFLPLNSNTEYIGISYNASNYFK